MVDKILKNNSERLFKQCIRYQVKFDFASSKVNNMRFAGATTQSIDEDRIIKLVDFFHMMLDRDWSSETIKKIMRKYHEKGNIKPQEHREIFLLFAIKRKLKLMSFMLNEEQFDFQFEEKNFVDVLENDVFDMGVLLHREYFLKITK
jgi:hypothetical protein